MQGQRGQTNLGLLTERQWLYPNHSVVPPEQGFRSQPPRSVSDRTGLIV